MKKTYSGKKLLDYIMRKYCFSSHEKLCTFTGLDRSTIHRLHYEKMPITAVHILVIYDTCQMTIEEIRDKLNEF